MAGPNSYKEPPLEEQLKDAWDQANKLRELLTVAENDLSSSERKLQEVRAHLQEEHRQGIELEQRLNRKLLDLTTELENTQSLLRVKAVNFGVQYLANSEVPREQYRDFVEEAYNYMREGLWKKEND